MRLATYLLIFLSSALTLNAQSFNDQLDQLLADYFDANAPGGALLIKKANSQVFARGFGIADMTTGEKITPSTVFNTGSISKTFVANAILILHEAGKLSVYDPVAMYFDFEHPEVVADIKLVHLLSHTSGLPDLRNVAAQKEFYLSAKDAENFAPLLKTERLNFPAGTKFQYSNPAYNGLALIIEKVSGMAWQSFVEERIFLSCDMPLSKITNGSYPDTNVAHAYDPVGSKWVENDYGEFPTFAAAGNGGIWSTVVELANYENAIEKRVFLSDGLIEKSRQPFKPGAWSSPSQPHLGFGWWMGESALFSDQPFGKHLIFHTGSQGGFRGYHILIPEEKILVVGLFNRPIERRIIRQILQIIADYNWLNK